MFYNIHNFHTNKLMINIKISNSTSGQNNVGVQLK